jgi:lipoprotein-releasing system permease protein
MPFELFLAFRYLRSRRKRRLARVTALVAILGIAVGVGALIVALALANGFRDEMREKILGGTAHINVMRSDGRPLNDHRELASRIASLPGVTRATGTTYDGAVIIGPQSAAYAVLRAVDTKSSQALNDLKRSLIEGAVDPLGIELSEDGGKRDSASPVNFPVVLGEELARHTGLHLGDVAEIVSASGNLNSEKLMAGQVRPSTRRVRVIGITRSGLFEYDSTWIYLSLDDASEISGTSHGASVISVQIADIYDAGRVAANIKSTLGNEYKTVDWQEANRPLFAALALERRMGLFVIVLIILIAALNITSTLILVVVERARDIGILGAMGASSKSIMGIFMIEGAIIGALGGLMGIVLGIIVCVIGNRYRLVSLPADVYSISNVPFHAQPRDVLIAALVAFFLSFLATIYPARAAARVRPVAMLRDSE